MVLKIFIPSVKYPTPVKNTTESTITIFPEESITTIFPNESI